jgi:uncharacterized membrane protein
VAGYWKQVQKIVSMNLLENTPVTKKQTFFRYLLGIMLMVAGTGHLTFVRQEFQAQVPNWIPLNKDLTVVLSGIVEIMLGMAIAFWSKKRVFWGWVAAIFFVLVFPGNIAQFVNHKDAFGLNSDLARSIRLLFQPVLIGWALWSTGAWLADKWKAKTL